MTSDAPCIAMLEDHPITRTGMKMALMPNYIISMEASTAGEFYSLMGGGKKIDLLLLDINLPDGSGVDVARRLRSESPDTKILVYSVEVSEQTLSQLLELNVEGIISKLSEEVAIQEAVRTVLNGGHFYLEDAEKLERDVLIAKSAKPNVTLTEREKAVMLACCKGMTDAEVADVLCISVRTVENHKLHIFRKWNINNTVEMLRYAIKSGIVTL